MVVIRVATADQLLAKSELILLSILGADPCFIEESYDLLEWIPLLRRQFGTYVISRPIFRRDKNHRLKPP